MTRWINAKSQMRLRRFGLVRYGQRQPYATLTYVSLSALLGMFMV